MALASFKSWMGTVALWGGLFLFVGGVEAAPLLSISPASGNQTVGTSFPVTINANTDGASVRGGGVVFEYNPAQFQVVGSVANASSGTFVLTPSVAAVSGRIEIPFHTPSFDSIAYNGALATVTLQPLVAAASAPVTISASSMTRFAPNAAGTIVTNAVFSLSPAPYAPSTSLLQAKTATPFPLGPAAGPFALNVPEHWHRLQLPACENARITVSFSHAAGDVQAQLFDARCDDSGQPFLVASSYTATNAETIMYANASGPADIFLRVYGEGGATNPAYTVLVETIGSDDAFESNSFPSVASTVSLGTTYDLVSKDDDFFRYSVSGIEALRIAVTHDFNQGQIYFQVLEDNGTYTVINGGASAYYTPNVSAMVLDPVFLGGRSTVVVRVFGANRGQNFYTLRAEASSLARTEPLASTIGAPIKPPEAVTFSMAELLPSALASIVAPSADDAFEPNNTISAAAAASAIPKNTTIAGLTMGADAQDWYKISLAGCENLRVTLNFLHAQGDLNMQVFDARCPIAGQNVVVAESYSQTDGETGTYVNSTRATELYLFVYGEGGATNPSYTMRVDATGTDDAFEPNSWPDSPAALLLGTHADLVCKDDDFFRIDTTGKSTLRAKLDHNFNSGQLYLQVLEDDGTYAVINGGASALYTPNQTSMELPAVPLGGRSHVVIRVFSANKGANYYDLTVQTND